MSNHSDRIINSTTTSTTTTPQDLGFHFLEMARLGLPRGPCDMDEDDESPTELNTINCSGFLLITTDKLSVKYTNANLHGHDVGIVQANKPAPVKRLFYYFEIHVKDAGAKGQISIGFTTDSFKMRRQPGWEPNICGYHGDDGLLYRGLGKKKPFGPMYTSGDTVGAGINYASQEFFFTKNGIIVGAVEKDMKGSLFPTIAVHSQNEEVQVNFGQKPFAFDLKVFEAQERMKQQTAIEEFSLPSNISYRIVRSYLQHCGYEDTLNVFDMACKNIFPPIYIAQENGFDEQDIMYAINQRKTLRQLIRKGEIDAALGKLSEWYPQIVQDEKSATCFLLHCQKFIELVRVGALEEAVEYGRNQLAKFYGLPGFQDLVQDSVALLAYERPQESPVSYLLEDLQREIVADAVNVVVLSTNPYVKDVQGCSQPYLERLLRQLTACCLVRRSLKGDQGEFFQLLTPQ